MSYILEALKKAQAERQLGSAPTIHSPAASAVPAAGPNRKPLVIGLAAGVVLVAVALLLWRRPDAPAVVAGPAATPGAVAAAPPSASAAVPVPAAATPAAQAVVTASAATPPAAATTGPAATLPVAAAPAAQAPALAPQASANSQVALVGKPDAAPKVAREAAAATKTPTPLTAQVATTSTPAATHVAGAPAPAVAAPAPAAEDSLPAFGALPEPVRRDIPKVAFGGYMYSPNPSDRLILIDNVLRHEGEEVAPGLVLEKLLPKGAVMNFRGNRYRVPF